MRVTSDRDTFLRSCDIEALHLLAAKRAVADACSDGVDAAVANLDDLVLAACFAEHCGR